MSELQGWIIVALLVLLLFKGFTATVSRSGPHGHDDKNP